MAKKNLGDIEKNNKNLSGVNLLISGPKTDEQTAKREIIQTEDDDTETAYPLRMKKSWLKHLKIMSAEKGVSVKALILNAVKDRYEL